jgi:hypothetical protein
MADAPGLMKYAVVKIDATDYASTATTALLSGEAPVQTLRTLVPNGVITDTDTAAYTFQIAGAQGTTLYSHLIATQGTTVACIFQAEFGTGKTLATFSAVVPAGLPLGGQQGQFRTFEITLPVVGAPVFTVSP